MNRTPSEHRATVLTQETSAAAPAVELQGVAVRYRLPSQPVRSFKEYVIRRLKGQIYYQDLWALQDISLSIRRGEFLGIIGRNGAGKSTLLKVIARVLRPTRGRVIVRGRLAPLLELGAGFHMDLTGRENVFLNGTLLGYRQDEIAAQFDAIVDFAELWDFIDMPVRAYSFGMLMRLGFSVATAFRPDILIVDEVLAVGDVQFRKKCMHRMEAFHTAGTTIILVSHHMDLIRRFCDRVVWIDHGRIRMVGDPETVIRAFTDHVTGHERRS